MPVYICTHFNLRVKKMSSTQYKVNNKNDKVNINEYKIRIKQILKNYKDKKT